MFYQGDSILLLFPLQKQMTTTCHVESKDQVSIEHFFPKSNITSDWKRKIEIKLFIQSAFTSWCRLMGIIRIHLMIYFLEGMFPCKSKGFHNFSLECIKHDKHYLKSRIEMWWQRTNRSWSPWRPWGYR